MKTLETQITRRTRGKGTDTDGTGIRTDNGCGFYGYDVGLAVCAHYTAVVCIKNASEIKPVPTNPARIQLRRLLSACVF